jgi:hypothetical protein
MHAGKPRLLGEQYFGHILAMEDLLLIAVFTVRIGWRGGSFNHSYLFAHTSLDVQYPNGPTDSLDPYCATKRFRLTLSFSRNSDFEISTTSGLFYVHP